MEIMSLNWQGDVVFWIEDVEESEEKKAHLPDLTMKKMTKRRMTTMITIMKKKKMMIKSNWKKKKKKKMMMMKVWR